MYLGNIRAAIILYLIPLLPYKHNTSHAKMKSIADLDDISDTSATARGGRASPTSQHGAGAARGGPRRRAARAACRPTAASTASAAWTSSQTFDTDERANV